MEDKNLLKDSKAYYEDNNYYEIFSIAEDGESKVSNYLKDVCKDKVVLDAGCGTGKFLPILEPIVKKYVGIDLSQDQLEKARKKAKQKNTIFIKSNLSKIVLESESFDVVISTWVLGTILDLDERKHCLNELKRVLKPNGKIIFVENDEGSEFEKLRDRTNDSRTRDYNNWIISNGFVVDKRFNTYFKFKTLNEAQNCFKVIYGDKSSNKIKTNKIQHNIIIFKYIKVI